MEVVASTLDAENVAKYFFGKHEVEFYDQDLYELMSKEYEEFK